ncbi:MAG: amidohydrolase family protein [Candidatus Latescibacteria bacterium]|nr:amidohydrolase family protein [Candidatus Latescibacterota bacterium]
MSQLSFFDCNCMIGRRTAPRPENNLSVEEILDELRRAGIDDALAVHAYAKEYDPRIGNGKLSEVCAVHREFTPCYVVLPEYTEEIPGGDAMLQYLEDGGARAVRLYPKEHNYGLDETWCGNLFATLGEAGVPILIDLDQTDWVEVDKVLSHHPELNLILLRTGYRIDRWVYPMFKNYPGLRLETAFYFLHLAIESVTERFGAERLIFGTGLPVWDAGGAVTPILYAAIDEGAKRKIAEENLRALLWRK